jgi:hypothetical protein
MFQWKKKRMRRLKRKRRKNRLMEGCWCHVAASYPCLWPRPSRDVCSYLSWRQYSSVKSLNTETCCTIVGLLSVLLVLSWVLPSGPISCRMKYELCYVTLFAAYSQPSSISYVGLRLQKKNSKKQKNERVCVHTFSDREEKTRTFSIVHPIWR